MTKQLTTINPATEEVINTYEIAAATCGKWNRIALERQ
jgi:hypothetical protein